MIIDVIIPAYNEEDAIVSVINDIPKNSVREIIVADNNSTDKTGERATSVGATVVKAKIQGYGAACLSAMKYIEEKKSPPDIIVFLDADYSDHPNEMNELLSAIENNEADLVIGNRVKSKRENGSMLPQQIIGNKIATLMIRFLYRFTYRDLGPFRAIRYSSLQQLQMKDQTYGWTVEMQVKALNHHLRVKQVEVSYRKRKGVSKISGTIKGTFLAGAKIINTIVKYR
jgi:glycosyltransferase involved in cell wall biosynthesis